MMGWFKPKALTTDTADVSVLMVCTANVCRSPMAEVLLTKLVADLDSIKIYVDSCGLKAGPVPTAPDPRARAVLEANGLELKGVKSRRFDDEDFYRFDLILAMDNSHLQELRARKPSDASADLSIFLPSATGEEQDRNVPDPYYGTPAGFDRVFELLETGCQFWLDELQRRQ